MLSLVRPSPLAWLLPFYLELLPSDGLHFSLLADGELVGDCGTFGVDVGPAEGVAVLGDLGDHLVVAALCDDVIGDACGGGGEARAVTSFFFFVLPFKRQADTKYSFFFPLPPPQPSLSHSFSLCLTEQLAELLVALLAFHFPFPGEGHGAAVGWSEASGDAEVSGGEE